MSDPSQKPADDTPHDPIEDLVHSIPIVLPVVGGVLIFLLAFASVLGLAYKKVKGEYALK